jgi:UDP-N-acetylglucosamine 2-epimerase
MPNFDAFHDAFHAVIKEYQAQYPFIHRVDNLGFARYIQALRYCVGVVGNSSSGLYETPLFNVPCLNIGTRQANRERAKNVIDCAYGEESVKAGLKTLLEDRTFLNSLQSVQSPFGSRPATPEIIAFIEYLQNMSSRP